MMKKHVLKISEPIDDFKVIGISSHENDYRLSWAINAQLGITFRKSENYCILDKKNNIEKQYSLYLYFEEDLYIKHFLVANNGQFGFLIPELKNIDFFIVITGEYDDVYIASFIDKLKKVSIISMSTRIDSQKLKSRKNFDFSHYE